MQILHELSNILSKNPSLHRRPPPFGPFNSFLQKRWKKPANTAQTRLETRTRDSNLDKLTHNLKRLKIIFKIHELMSTRKRGPFVSLQLMSRWKNLAGLNVPVSSFVQKYPHVFDVFQNPVKGNLCCKLRGKMRDMIEEEKGLVKRLEFDAVVRVKKLMTISGNGSLCVHALRLMRKELGLPEDFRESILGKYRDFRLVDLERVELVDIDENLGIAEIEKWREKEYKEKWLSEFETKYAFPINFPTGFKIVAGYRQKLKNWQRLPYVKPYERKDVVRARTSGGVGRYEKRAVGIIHEILCLTIEKMVEIEKLAHFRKDFGIEVNIRELLLKHPGIFYISTKGSTQAVFLQEAYRKGRLVETNPIYEVRRKMLDLVLLGIRNTRELQPRREVDAQENVVSKELMGAKRDGDWVLPILEGFGNRNTENELYESHLSDKEHSEYDYEGAQKLKFRIPLVSIATAQLCKSDACSDFSGFRDDQILAPTEKTDGLSFYLSGNCRTTRKSSFDSARGEGTRQEDETDRVAFNCRSSGSPLIIWCCDAASRIELSTCFAGHASWLCLIKAGLSYDCNSLYGLGKHE